MAKKEFMVYSAKLAKIKWDKMQNADNYKRALENIIKELKADGFKLIIIGNDIRVTF